MATFGYGRVSREDLTAENQRQELEQRGYAIDYWYSDTTSGKTPAAARPQFADLLSKIRAGETLVVSKLDRLGRDSVDALSTLRALEARKVRVIVAQLGDIDLNGTAGKMITAVLAAVAEMERDLIIERTNAGLARARAQGKKLGRPFALSGAQIAEVRTRLIAGASPSALAREFGVSRAAIYRAVGSKTAALAAKGGA